MRVGIVAISAIIGLLTSFLSALAYSQSISSGINSPKRLICAKSLFELCKSVIKSSVYFRGSNFQKFNLLYLVYLINLYFKQNAKFVLHRK